MNDIFFKNVEQSRSSYMLSLLDLESLFHFEKCQQSQGSWESGSRSVEVSSLLDTRIFLEFAKCQKSYKLGGGLTVSVDGFKKRGLGGRSPRPLQTTLSGQPSLQQKW